MLVPTVELLTQTAHAYVVYLGAASGLVAAVCGDARATDAAATLRSEVHGPHAPVTTDPHDIAHVVRRRGRITVFATYASLAVIIAAHTEYRLPGWDLIVIDEAHRTAGLAGRWAQVHDDRLLPARRRLYSTATPRVPTTGGVDLISMDDPTVFGRRVFHLSFAAAIDADLLADYRVAVVTVTDGEVAKLTASQQIVTVDGHAVSARMLGMQIALAKAIRDYRLRRVITYHGRVLSARRFAAGLRRAIDMLPTDHRPYRPVHAHWVSGDMPPDRRRHALAALREPGESTVVLANARVLAEGVDVPALDAVMFADPRDSATDVVQAVGRAVRRGPDSTKVATIIVPIFLTEDENPTAALEGSEFDTVWRVVRALRAHDERIADYLAARRRSTNRRDRTSPDHEPAPPWLHIDGAPARVGDEFHRSILLRTVDTTAVSWWDSYDALVAYHTEHGTAEVPHNHVTLDGHALGAWLANQRRRHRDGNLTDAETAALHALGIDPADRRRRDPGHDTQWAENISAARAFHAEHGHLDIPETYRTPDGRRLGTWLRHCRGHHHAGTLRPDRIAQLEALDIDWRPLHTQWLRAIDALREFRAQHGHIDVPQRHVTSDGLRLGTWLNSNRRHRRLGHLSPERIAQLDDLGVAWDPSATAWHTGLRRFAEYRREHGTGRVPLRYVTADGYKLGNWIATQRRNYHAGTLSSDRVSTLEALGMDWNPCETLWTTGIDLLITYRNEHGTVAVPSKYITANGFHLGSWLTTRRKQYRAGALHPDRAAQLRALGVDLGPPPPGQSHTR